MRISSAQLFNLGVDAIHEQRSALSQTSLQLASGKRILSPSDDPTGTVQSLELKTAIDTTHQYQKNMVLAEARLSLEETTLRDVENSMQRVRVLALQANNGSQTDQDRQFIATEVRQRLDELLALANTRDANGEYLFAGHQSHTEPFAPDGAGGFSYFGDDRQRFLQISSSRQVAIGDSGNAVFRQIPNGNGTFTVRDNPANAGNGVIDAGSVTDPAAWVPDTYTITFTAADSYEVRDSGGSLVAGGAYASGAAIAFAGIQTNITGEPQAGDSFTVAPSASQDIFATYQNLIDALETSASDDASRARLNNAINRVLVDLDQGLGNVLDTRASIGARLNVTDSQSDINEGAILSLEETLSDIRDLDYAEAISRLKLQLAGLQAAQQSYVQVQRLSLFDYIR